MKNMMKVITSISVLSLVLITFGVTLAFYSYVKRGSTENTIQSGAITFIYTEIDGQGAGIGITDALPMSDALGVAQTGERNLFNYKIKSENPTDKYINYTVTVRKKSTGTELDNYIKLNVKEVGGSYNKTKFYKDLPLYNDLNNERIIYQGEVTNDPNYEKDFQLRMWLSDTLTLDENTNDKSFSLTVNVYANGADVSASANCGKPVCDNPAFAEYMENGDQALVGQFIRINPPTGGTSADSFSGNAYTTDWMKAFIRPFEYMKIYDSKINAPYTYPSTSDVNAWSNYVAKKIWIDYPNTLIPKLLDDRTYSYTGHHINLWFASMSNWTGNDHMLGIAGVYLPPTVTFKIISNNPTRGYAEFSLQSDNVNEELYLAVVGSNYNWSQVMYKNNTWGDRSSGNAKRPFTLVYNVDAFKTYLNGLSADSLMSFISERLFLLAECNIPNDD